MATGDKRPVVMSADRAAAYGIATLGADAKLSDSQIPIQKIMAVTNAAEYSSANTYALGSYCTRDGKLYRCTTAITTSETWTEAHWTETTVGAELIAIYTALQNKASAYEHQPEIEITSDYFDVPIYVKKDDAGNVHISIWNALTLKTIPQYGWATMCNIPIGYRPSHTILATSYFTSSTQTVLYSSVMLMVDAAGNLQVSGGGDRGVAIPNNSHIHFSCSWGT